MMSLLMCKHEKLFRGHPRLAAVAAPAMPAVKEELTQPTHIMQYSYTMDMVPSGCVDTMLTCKLNGSTAVILNVILIINWRFLSVNASLHNSAPLMLGPTGVFRCA